MLLALPEKRLRTTGSDEVIPVEYFLILRIARLISEKGFSRAYQDELVKVSSLREDADRPSELRTNSTARRDLVSEGVRSSLIERLDPHPCSQRPPSSSYCCSLRS